MAMPCDPDLSEAWCQGHYGTREEAQAMADDIEKLTHLQGAPLPRVVVEADKAGGWNVWIWE